MGAEWSIGLGILIYFIAIIMGIYYFSKYKQWSVVSFIASMATYVFAVFYTWDVFELNKSKVLVLCIISTIIMFTVGHYFAQVDLFTTQNEKKNQRKKN